MKKHIAVSVQGLEDRLLGKISKKYGSWQILQHEDTGEFLTASEVMAEIVHAREKGYEVLPTCSNPDKRGYCQGHIE